MSLNCPMCNRNGCEKPADGMLAIEFYPPAAVLAHYRTSKPITSLIIGMELCAEHAAQIDAAQFLGDNFEKLAGAIEHSSGTAVDRKGAKAVLVPFTDPGVLKLREQSEQLKGGAA